MSTPSTPKTSSLAARLQADQAATQRQLVDQTQQLLWQHVASLKKLLYAEHCSIKSALELQRAELDGLHRRTLCRMRWMLLWPIAALLLTSALIVLGVAGWTSYRLDQIDQAQAAVDRATAQLAAREALHSQTPVPRTPPTPQSPPQRKR